MQSLRFGSAVSAVALASMIAGCAAPASRNGPAFNAAKANLAYGLRAQIALEAGDFTSAIDFAEKAVEGTPQDSTVRGLLGNAYFAAGRFASAEAAYGDSLSLAPVQPQVILKRALVQIAQGKNGQAILLLQSAREMIEPADYGLAVALAGQPAQAVEVLEPAARSQDADSRVRQNLALAYALAGDWTAARTIAAQDVPGDALDARIQQWMALAKPGRSSDQVAALVGVRPADTDPGQPVRLALNALDTRLAAVAPVQPPVQVAQAFAAPVQQTVASDVPSVPAFAAPVAAPAPLPVVAPVAEPVAPAPAVIAQPVVQAAAPVAAPAAVAEAEASAKAIAAAAAIAPEAPAAFAVMTSNFAPAPKAAAKPAAAPRKSVAVRNAAAPRPISGNSDAVVQLGAYHSAERVSVAWTELTKKFPALASYSPMRARFDSAKGTVWRLSIRGFDSQRDAIARCETLRNRGGNCFVRANAGDAPVQFASR